MSFPERLKADAALVQARLDQAMAGLAEQPVIHAMRYAVQGGKRLRAFLVLESARMLGMEEARALPVAAAVEALHAYSLVHDDLPAMDDDDLRRGRPTVHKAFDEATAILAGDALLTLAFEVLADEETHESGAVRAALVSCLARASGLGGMVGGQMFDLAAEGRFEAVRGALPEAEIRRLQAMKTGALLAASVEIGARLGGADAAALAAFGRYGRALGATFQIADDILDVESDAEQMGKATAKDADKGKGMLVGALGLDGAKRERDRLSAEAVEALSGFGPEADVLRAAARFAAERKS